MKRKIIDAKFFTVQVTKKIPQPFRKGELHKMVSTPVTQEKGNFLTTPSSATFLTELEPPLSHTRSSTPPLGAYPVGVERNTSTTC